MTDPRPVMGLEHLAIPNESGNARWLEIQAQKKEAAIGLVANAAARYFGRQLPPALYQDFAERVIADLDNLL